MHNAHLLLSDKPTQLVTSTTVALCCADQVKYRLWSLGEIKTSWPDSRKQLTTSVVVLEESPCPRGPIYKSLSLSLKSLSLGRNSLNTTLLTTPTSLTGDVRQKYSATQQQRAKIHNRTGISGAACNFTLTCH